MSIASTPLLEKEKKGAGEEEAAKSSPQATFESKGDPTAQSQSQAQTSPIRYGLRYHGNVLHTHFISDSGVI